MGKREREDNGQEPPKKYSKKRNTYAICFGYLGTGFHGSQKQTGSAIATIEGELENAMIDLGIIDAREKWTRAARTDKGVHAIGNLVTITASEEIPIDKINDKLQNIKIFFAHKVISKFDARLQCDKRRYEYLIPRNVAPGDEYFSKKLETAFAEFKGTHNFHNFTSGIQATDPQAMRYIISAEISDVDENFVKVVLVGQSFLLNQIRKMVACAIEFSLGRVELEDIHKYLSPDFRKNLPMAPAEGLLLDRLFYDMYDERKCNYQDVLPIAWSLKEAEDRIESFKREVVYPEVMAKLPQVMGSWLSQISSASVVQEDEEPQRAAVEAD